ncbi:MAG: hypothetical protein FWD83_04360 [Promicromonosporaceae bacterium]|nr:hypothetical protein [Promicromonosporaceae bacterium]
MAKSDLTAVDEQLPVLAFARAGLQPVRLMPGDGEVSFEFDLAGVSPGVSLVEAERVDRLRFLVNIAELEPLSLVYEFSLAPGNLVVADGLRPRVLLRDVAGPASDGASFVTKYLALAGELLGRGRYEDFLAGGSDLLGKHRLLAEIAKLETAAEIRDSLLAAWQANVAAEKTSKVKVSRVGWRALQVAVPVLVLALAATSFIAVRSTLGVIPGQDRVIRASQAYVDGSFLEVQEAMSGVPLADMSFETRHLLARAYVVSLPLPEDQREWVQAGLTRRADGMLFDYWIHLGRLEFAQALNIAQRFGDQQLILVAYTNEYAFLQADVMAPDRQARLTYLRGHIDRMISERERAAEALGGDA